MQVKIAETISGDSAATCSPSWTTTSLPLNTPQRFDRAQVQHMESCCERAPGALGEPAHGGVAGGSARIRALGIYDGLPRMKPIGTSPPAMRPKDTVFLKVILLDVEVAQLVKPMGRQ